MEKATAVPLLEDLAFEVSYKDVLSNLLLCHDHRPEGKKLDWASFSSFLSTFPSFNGERMRLLIRACLDEYAYGIMGDKIR